MESLSPLSPQSENGCHLLWWIGVKMTVSTRAVAVSVKIAVDTDLAYVGAE